MSYVPRLALIAMLLLATAPVLAQQQTPQTGTIPDVMHDKSGMTSNKQDRMPDASQADQALMGSMMKMQHSMDVHLTGDADRDFAAMMIPHHQGAIDMAKAELKYGKDPALRKMAEVIVAAQEQEIAELQRWLAEHGR